MRHGKLLRVLTLLLLNACFNTPTKKSPIANETYFNDLSYSDTTTINPSKSSSASSRTTKNTSRIEPAAKESSNSANTLSKTETTNILSIPIKASEPNNNTNSVTSSNPINIGNKKHFKTLWLEPMWHNNYTSYNDVKAYLTQVKNLGFERIVIAYTYNDWTHCFLYTPKVKSTFISFDYDSKNKTLSYTTIDSNNPTSSCPSFDQYKNFLNYFFTASDELNLKIILGLSRTGDVYLLNDIENKIYGNTSSMVMPGYDINSRLSTAVLLSKEMATDLNSQYGNRKSFEGWYLAHETNCLDVGANYFYPISAFLKTISNKKVMISPTVDARMCFGGSLLDFATNYKGLIDIYSYQDTVGAGTIHVNGYGAYYYSLAARNQRIYQLVNSGLLYSLKLIHAQTGTEFQINAEGWEMDGSVGYGGAYAGDWSRIQTQLNAYSTYTENIMLNEGFLLFDFGLKTLSFENDSKNYSSATKFTEDYINYLKN